MADYGRVKKENMDLKLENEKLKSVLFGSFF